MLNPGPFCRMMEERKRSLIKWPSPTVDKTRREQTGICRLTRRKIFFFFKPIKYEQLVSHAKNKLHFFLFFWLLFVFFYGEFLAGKLKHIRVRREWKCAQRRIDRYKHRQTDVLSRRTKRSRGRQKAYRVLATACERRPVGAGSDWQLGQGFQSHTGLAFAFVN